MKEILRHPVLGIMFVLIATLTRYMSFGDKIPVLIYSIGVSLLGIAMIVKDVPLGKETHKKVLVTVGWLFLGGGAILGLRFMHLVLSS